MRKVTICLLAVVMVMVAGAAMAVNTTNPLAVTATVASKCTITSVADIAFGSYDPTSASPADAAGNMIFSCVKNTSYKTYISGTRSMTGGGDTLNFELYSDSGRSATFPSTSPGSGVTAPSRAPITTSIYGRIAAAQDVGVASYTGTVVATVEY